MIIFFFLEVRYSIIILVEEPTSMVLSSLIPLLNLQFHRLNLNAYFHAKAAKAEINGEKERIVCKYAIYTINYTVTTEL